MATITPINRYTEQVIEDDGTKAYKIYNNASPHYYMDKTGSLNPIDITNVQTITKDTVGVIKLREKNFHLLKSIMDFLVLAAQFSRINSMENQIRSQKKR